MASVRFTDVQARPTEFLDFTSWTLDEFQQLVPPFEAAFHAHMAAWRLDGKPRTARQFAVYKNCPLPTPGHWFRLMADPHEQFCWTSRQCRGMLLRRETSLSSGGDYDIDPKAMSLL